MSNTSNETIATTAIVARAGGPRHETAPSVASAQPTSAAERDVLERVVGSHINFLPVSFLEEGARVQRAVGRIVLSDGAMGTGSLVGESLLLTNHHVFPSVSAARTAQVEFNYQNDLDGSSLPVDGYGLDPDGLFVTSERLDYSLVRVQAKRSRSRLLPLPLPRRAGMRWGWLRLPSGSVQYRLEQLVNIIQHPAGRRKEVALQENAIVKISGDFIRYETDTEPGSSGSPVFDNDWDLIALHHAGGDQAPGNPGGGVWLNNEGVRIDAIVKDLLAQLATHPQGAQVKGELGL